MAGRKLFRNFRRPGISGISGILFVGLSFGCAVHQLVSAAFPA